MTREKWRELSPLDQTDSAIYFLEAALTSLPPPEDPGRARWQPHELACRHVLAHFLKFRQTLISEIVCHGVRHSPV